MTAHSVAIAKAALAASLLRPDPLPILRDNISDFHQLLQNVMVRCSRDNVQKCKYWVITNILPSTARCTALGKLLVALSTSMSTPVINDNVKPTKPSRKRQCLHLLYLLNDMLHHTRRVSNDVTVAGKFQPVLVDMFTSVASFDKCSKHHRKLYDLLDIWRKADYYSDDYIGKLRETVTSAAQGQASGTIQHISDEQDLLDAALMRNRNVPYLMPAMHGEHNTPWFDLPAANIMPHIMPNSTRPIHPSSIRPLQLVAGPADVDLVEAVKSFLSDANRMFSDVADISTMEEASPDIDELGQVMKRNEAADNPSDGEAYYGWSKLFCKKMKRRGHMDHVLNSRSHAAKFSRSRSVSTRSSSPPVSRHTYNRDRSLSRDRSQYQRKRSRSSNSYDSNNNHARPRTQSPPYSPRLQQATHAGQDKFHGSIDPTRFGENDLSSRTNSANINMPITRNNYSLPSYSTNAPVYNNVAHGSYPPPPPPPPPPPLPLHVPGVWPPAPYHTQQHPIFHGQFVPAPPLNNYAQQTMGQQQWNSNSYQNSSSYQNQPQQTNHYGSYGSSDRGNYGTTRGPRGRGW